MSRASDFLGKVLFSKPKRTFLAASAFWYLSLFPGRLGFDYSEAIRIMNRGESTSWWTSSYWWFLRITSLDGETIAISSLVTLLILGYSLVHLCDSLPVATQIKEKSLVIISLTPLYGAFGVNVSHDALLTASIILFTSVQIRLYSRLEKNTRADFSTLVLASLAAITTHYGIFVIAINIICILFQYRAKIYILIAPLSLLIMQLSTFGVTQVPTFGPISPMVADIKCVTQHPGADISESEWEYLIAIAPRSEWQNSTSCAMVDIQFEVMPSLDLKNVELNFDFIKIYLSIAGKNAAIPAMAHFQRASVALPPPFFVGQPNQVILDPSIPIGEGTNTALQTNPGVLHPSIDEPSVVNKIKLLAPLEIVAQGLIFIVNQASWFWGWGGLWLWPFALFVFFQIKKGRMKSSVPILSGTLILHLLLLIFAAPLPRYVMSTIILGVYFTIIMCVKTHSQYLDRMRE